MNSNETIFVKRNRRGLSERLDANMRHFEFGGKNRE